MKDGNCDNSSLLDLKNLQPCSRGHACLIYKTFPLCAVVDSAKESFPVVQSKYLPVTCVHRYEFKRTDGTILEVCLCEVRKEVFARKRR